MVLTGERQKLVTEKQAERASRIPPAWILPAQITQHIDPGLNVSAFDLFHETTLLSPTEIDLTEDYSAEELVELMIAREVTSTQVTTAFCKRAAIAQQLTNCLTEIFFSEALRRAQVLDDFLVRERRPMGPFHGLPISLEDTFMVKGEATTLGFVSNLAKPVAKDNSTLVEVLVKGGAVLYVKTNVPHALFTCESYNNVFGKTRNPYRLAFSGSSSGEGALVSFRGSVLGVGSDIAGSIRAPALCNGTFGFKPSAGRLPFGGQETLVRKGWPGVVPVAGPLTNTAKDLTFFFKNVLQGQPWVFDSTALAIPWRNVPRKVVLTIGVLLEDPMYPVSPPIARSLQTAAEKLKLVGHRVVILPQCPSLDTGVAGAIRSLKLGTKKSSHRFLADAGEESVQAVASLAFALAAENEQIGLDDIWQFVAEREDYKEAWGKIWRQDRLDVLLCPGSCGPTPRHDGYDVPMYTMAWNFIDFPASIIPLMAAGPEFNDQLTEGSNAYDVDAVPCHVQIVGWQYQDEEVLMATEIIAEAIQT